MDEVWNVYPFPSALWLRYWRLTRSVNWFFLESDFEDVLVSILSDSTITWGGTNYSASALVQSQQEENRKSEKSLWYMMNIVIWLLYLNIMVPW